MPRHPMGDDFMPVPEFARRMGKSATWAMCELRKDAEREQKTYPFAIATRNAKTRTWSYRINRGQFERWFAGGVGEPELDMERLADLVAERVVARLAFVRKAGGGPHETT